MKRTLEPSAALLTALSVLIFAIGDAGCGSRSSSAVCATNCGVTPSEVLYGMPAEALINTSVIAGIDVSTGEFSSHSGGNVPFLSSGGMAAVGTRFLYVSVGPNIYAYSIDPSSGNLTTLAGSPFSFPGRSVQELAGTPDGSLLYAADAAGGVDAFQVNRTTGGLSLLSGSPFGSGTDYQIVVHPSGGYLYATDYTDGEVFAFAIAPTGALTPLQGSPFLLPNGGSSEPLGIVDTGSFVYVAMAGSNQIAGLSVNPATGALATIPGSPFAAGRYPGDMVWTGSFLYGVNEADANIFGYRLDPSSGALTQLAGSPFLPYSVAKITIDPSGKYMFVSQTVGVFSARINPSTGALTQDAPGWANDGSLWLTVVQLPPSTAP